MDFDVFISFKNSDENGLPTRDAKLAGQVYGKLSSKGLRVFFSSESLEQLGVSDYKKTIDSALDAASVLVAVGTSARNLSSEWVRYEWDGFYMDVLNRVKPEGKVFTYIEGMQPADLPRSLRQGQIFVHSEEALQRLYEFVSEALRHESRTLPAPHPYPLAFVSSLKEDDQYFNAIGQQLTARGFAVSSTLGIAEMNLQDPLAFRKRMIAESRLFVPIISQNTERYSWLLEDDWRLALEGRKRLGSDKYKIAGVVAGGLENPRNIPESFRDALTPMQGPDVPREFVDQLEEIVRSDTN
jgi:hypothetical protein